MRRERVLIVDGGNPGREGLEAASSRLAELTGLVESAGGVVVGEMNQRRSDRPGRQFLGKGKMAELSEACVREKCDLVVAGQDLSPLQSRILEDAVPCRVIDRTALILDIFAQRARSKEGQLQVELAQHLYRLPRLTGRGQELSRLGAGLGTRGPGEQKLEYDRRRIRKRMTRLKDEIERLRDRRGRQRERRQERAWPSLVLVGYTNAGKSTLFNRVSKAHAVADRRMFATLDPQVRQVHMPGGGKALLSDTVGFIRELPDDLRVAFRATLEEITAADALVHVVGCDHADVEKQIETVLAELEGLGAGNCPILTVMNKSDRIGSPRGRLEALAATRRPSVFTSALKGEGIEDFLKELEGMLRTSVWTRLEWENPPSWLGNRLRALGVSTRIAPDTGKRGGQSRMEAWLTPALAEQVRAEDTRS